MKKIVLGVFCAACFWGNAQVQGQYQVGTDAGISWKRVSLANQREAETIAGSQYIVSSYFPARISGYEKEIFGLRYNAVQDEMEFEKEGEVYHLPRLDEMKIVFPNQNNKTYAFLDYTEKGNNISGFLVVLADNVNIKLYKKESIRYIPAKYAVSSYDTSQSAQYVRSKDMYFVENEGSIKEFPNKRKELIKMFPNKETEITAFLKKNKISFSKEADLISLTNFLNSL